MKDAEQNPMVNGVVIVHSWPWFSSKERKTKETHVERDDIADYILGLEFNKQRGEKFLIMLSGDVHNMAYSHAGTSSNPRGGFPIF